MKGLPSKESHDKAKPLASEILRQFVRRFGSRQCWEEDFEEHQKSMLHCYILVLIVPIDLIDLIDLIDQIALCTDFGFGFGFDSVLAFALAKYLEAHCR